MGCFIGGQVEAMSFAFGEDNIVLIVDFPDPVSMAAVSLTVKASGALHTRATPLLTLDEIDEAARRQVTFRSPAREPGTLGPGTRNRPCRLTPSVTDQAVSPAING
ncbi:GYD domain-containing protein [Streptomyces sp. NPDC056723]|uniref:GYD domain-containing protein n=1 Tax=Streptomyces sp. NPDC056723 TaxID=3345925 RepID=UPI003689C3F5